MTSLSFLSTYAGDTYMYRLVRPTRAIFTKTAFRERVDMVKTTKAFGCWFWPVRERRDNKEVGSVAGG